jgi:hypothetical protein
MNYNLLATLVIIALGINTIHAQDPAEDEFGAWYIIATNNTISDKISIQAQTQFRFYELASELQQFKIRLGGTYRFSEKVSAALGYGYFRNDPSYMLEMPENFDEHRLVTDVNFFGSLGAVKLRHRYRMENRFFSNDIDTSTWLRYMLKLSYPINAKWTIDLYDEVFLNVEQPVFAQNWIGAGLTYAIADAIKTRIGYQKIQFEGADFDRLLVGITFSTDFRKNETNKN